MMTNKELLIYSAKQAGIIGRYISNPMMECIQQDDGTPWNPLTTDLFPEISTRVEERCVTAKLGDNIASVPRTDDLQADILRAKTYFMSIKGTYKS